MNPIPLRLLCVSFSKLALKLPQILFVLPRKVDVPRIKKLRMPRIWFAVAVLVLGLALAAPAPDDIDDDEVSRLAYIQRADKSPRVQNIPLCPDYVSATSVLLVSTMIYLSLFLYSNF